MNNAGSVLLGIDPRGRFQGGARPREPAAADEDLLQRAQEMEHVRPAGRLAHEPDAPHPALERAQSAADLDSAKFAARVADYEVGAKVSVSYDPSNPSEAQITDFTQFWLGPLGVGVFGFLFLVGGIGAFFLIKGSDAAFGPQFQRKMDAVELSVGKQGIRLEGRVDSVRKHAGRSGEEYIVVCRATLPGGITQQKFAAEPIFFDPGPWILGKGVEIYVDPRNKDRYAVMLDPLLARLGK